MHLRGVALLQVFYTHKKKESHWDLKPGRRPSSASSRLAIYVCQRLMFDYRGSYTEVYTSFHVAISDIYAVSETSFLFYLFKVTVWHGRSRSRHGHVNQA
jgi:hypothetical protein